jgi:5-methyltetrahydrofolate--homocysteine methyltransferase
MKKSLSQMFDGIMNGDIEQVKESVKAAVDGGMSADEILHSGLIPPMAEVGRLFEEGEYFVPEMLVAARAMQGGLDIIRPLLLDADIQPIGKVVLGTVKGDLHDIGKNLVGMMLEGGGFEVIDLGTDVSPETFVDSIKKNGADILGMSALLTTTMHQMEATISAVKETGIRDAVKIIIGGAPVTPEFAEKIGADGFAPDASQAVRLAKTLTGVL